MDRLRGGAVLLAVLSAAPVSAQAQAHVQAVATAPDPATIAVPDLAFVPTSSDRGNFHRYFFYWKAGVSFERASADLTECYTHMAGGVRYMPFALSLNETPAPAPGKAQPHPVAPNNYGVVGAVIGGLIGTTTFRDGQQRFRMCMGFKNYTRYGASKTLWERIAGGEPLRAIAVQARIASGPKPAGEPIDP